MHICEYVCVCVCVHIYIHIYIYIYICMYKLSVNALPWFLHVPENLDNFSFVPSGLENLFSLTNSWNNICLSKCLLCWKWILAQQAFLRRFLCTIIEHFNVIYWLAQCICVCVCVCIYIYIYIVPCVFYAELQFSPGNLKKNISHVGKPSLCIISYRYKIEHMFCVILHYTGWLRTHVYIIM